MDGAVHTYKASLVAKGFTQTLGNDYEETFSPVADIRAIRILISIDVFYDYEIWKMDVKTAFLNGYLNEEVYMEQPEGFVSQKYPNRVCKLKRSIYGLKQASKQLNKQFDDEINKFGFSQNCDEPCVYVKASGSYVTFLILYVDDILIMGNNIPMLQDIKSNLGRCFAMKDLGEAAYILRIKIYPDRSKQLIGLCKNAYIEKILKRYYMENSKHGTIPMQEKLKFSKSQGASTPAKIQRMQNIPYASAVGSIMYVVRCSRPDVTGYVFVLNGGAVDWKSTKQSIFATSSTDVEYIAAFDVSKKATWIRKFISGLGVVPTIEEPVNMYCDNTKGARHFRAKFHYLRETIKIGDVKIEKVDTYDNLADPFSKALAFPKHSELTEKIGMIPASSLT
ncbi:retrotransposon protein, putative, ty1-copia subclass [Tanacetum coccineum]